MMDEPVHRPLVVLVVDDTPETISLLTHALDELDIVVLVALSGEKAIEIARRALPDIVLMDAVMPGLDGFDTCRRMKEDEALAHIPVIFMTGLDETEHIAHAFAVGGTDYVTKPIVVGEMLARMRLRQESAHRAHIAHLALDATQRFLLAIDGQCNVLWASPHARRLLGDAGLAREGRAARLDVDLAALRKSATFATREFSFAFLGQLAPGEFLLRVARHQAEGLSAESGPSFRERFGLTPREAEILSWLTRGKSNRDIAEILRLSPRTVDKHLETIFRKLGVENRTAAAALAMNDGRDAERP